MENIFNHFNEIIIKSKVEYKMFKNYFHQDKNEFAVHNSFQFTNNKFFISGFGLFNLLQDYKINFKEIANNDKFILLKLNKTSEKELKEIIEFYQNTSTSINKNNKIELENEITFTSTNQLNLEYILILKDLLIFYERYSSYFTDVDNYFNMNDIINRIGCSSFFILSNSHTNNGNNEIGHIKFNFSNNFNNISIGEEILAITSSLGVISYPHFSNSFSKGIISNMLAKNILLLDIRVLPNSHGSIIFNKKSNPVGIVLPVLNVKYSYTPVVYGLKINLIFEILNEIYNTKNNENNNNFKLDKVEIKLQDKITNLKDTVFIIYNTRNYATCFYIGNGYFITNKHFFKNTELDEENIYVKNYKLTLNCKKYFIPKNNLDLAIVKIRNYIKEDFLDNIIVPIKFSPNKVKLLQTIYCVSFSYFDRREILNELKLPNVNKGIISNKLNIKSLNSLNNFDMIYGVDCACYSGGSGGPIVDSEGELIGVLYQNLIFNTEENIMQLPNSSFIISKEIVKIFVDVLLTYENSFEKLNKLWISKMSNEEVDIYLNFTKFSPKF